MIWTFAERKCLCIKVDATNDSFQFDELGMRGSVCVESASLSLRIRWRELRVSVALR